MPDQRFQQISRGDIPVNDSLPNPSEPFHQAPQQEQVDQPDEAVAASAAPGASAASLLSEEPRRVAQQIEELPAADGATVLQNLPSERAADVAEYLNPQTAGDILAEMEPPDAATIITDMEAPEASMVLAAMDPDDRVDILEHVTDPLHDQLVGEMESDDAAEVRHLEQYPPDTAGGIMNPQVTALPEDLTVEQAIAELRRLSEELEQMFYVYVVDRRRHLVGVLSMRDLILARPDKKLNQIMSLDVKSVPATMDQEEVARLISRYNYLALPVVDNRHRLLGLVTVDDAVDVLQQEATEDVQVMFGAGAEERLNSPWTYSFRKRVWWLQVNLLTAFLAAAVVGFFESTITKLAILAAYMPIVAGMGGNASAQAMSVSIRGIALSKVDWALMRRVLFKEMMVGVLTGIVVGLTTFGIALFFHARDMAHQQTLVLGAVVATALIINHTLATVSGAAIPFLLQRLGQDPAQSATIFATTVTDIAGFFSLLGLAYLCMAMGWLPGR